VCLQEVVCCNERRKNGGISAAIACPKKSRRKKFIISEVTGFDGSAVCQIVYDFTATEKEKPVQRMISSKICELTSC
jgi:hypothetical protein